MPDRLKRITISDLRGGRNGALSPTLIPDTQVTEAINVDWWRTSVCRKRGGIKAINLGSSSFAGNVVRLWSHLPSASESGEELWGVDDTGVLQRYSGGSWSTPSLKDAGTGNPWEWQAVSFNGKLFFAYESGVDRLHVWDPTSASVRRTGLATMAAPTVANTGVGAYPAVIRYYRTRAVEQRSGVVYRRSEPSSSTSFTPSGAGAAARITQGTVPGEGETHWEVEASTDNLTFYRLATVVIGTTTYDDSALVATYPNNPLSDVTGTYALQSSYRFVAADQGRVVGFGNFTSTNPQSRFEFSAIYGTVIGADDERVPTNNWQGLNEKTGGSCSALVGPLNGSFFAFKHLEFWKLTPTGNTSQPYAAVRISPSVGAVRGGAVTLGENEYGNPTLYWWSYRGPYRYNQGNIEYLGKHIEDVTVNIGLYANNAIPAWSAWVPTERKVVFCYSTWNGLGSAFAYPTNCAVLSVGNAPVAASESIPYGWSLFTGDFVKAICGTLATTHNTNKDKSLRRLYISTWNSGTPAVGIYSYDTQDAVNGAFTSSMTTKAYQPWEDGFYGAVQGGQVLAPTANMSLTMGIVPDFITANATSDTVSLFDSSASRVQPRIGGGFVCGDAQLVQFTISDSGSTVQWSLDELSVSIKRNAPIVG